MYKKAKMMHAFGILHSSEFSPFIDTVIYASSEEPKFKKTSC